MRVRSIFNNAAPTSHTVNVTPMIDVIMCLIIFYLIVGKLAADQQVNVRLPEAYSGLEPDDQRSLIITVLPADTSADDGVRMLHEGNEVAAAELPGLIRSHRLVDADVWVQIRADRALGFGQVLPVIRACKQVGAANIKLSVEPAS